MGILLKRPYVSMHVGPRCSGQPWLPLTIHARHGGEDDVEEEDVP